MTANKSNSATIGHIHNFMSLMHSAFDYEKKVSTATTEEEIPKLPQQLKYFHKIMESKVNLSIMRVYEFGKLIRTQEINVLIANQTTWNRIKNGFSIGFKREVSI